MGRWHVVLVTVAACGRVAFDPATEPDAQTDGPPIAMRDDCLGYETALFCDGFEDPALAKWQIFGQTASMPVTTPAPPHGDRVLQADTQGTQQSADMFVVLANPIASGTAYVRGWFYMSSTSLVHADLIDFNGVGAGGLAILAYFGDIALYQSTQGSGSRQGTPMPTDRWVCVGLQIEVSNPGSAYLSLDGTQVASFTNLDLVPGAGFQKIAVGIPWTDDGQPAVRTYADEIIVDTKPIACD